MIPSTDTPTLSVTLNGTRYVAFEMHFDARREGLANWQERMRLMKFERDGYANRMRRVKYGGHE